MKITVINGIVVEDGKRLCKWDKCSNTFYPFNPKKEFCCSNHMKYYYRKYKAS